MQLNESDVDLASIPNVLPAPPAVQNVTLKKPLFEAVEWGDEEVSRSILERIRPKAGETIRIAILNFRPIRAKTHFADKLGRMICEGNGCCKRFGEPKQTILAMALLYLNTNPANGRFTKGPDGTIPTIAYKIGFLDVGVQNFKVLSSIAGENAAISDVDITMSYKNAGQPIQGFHFARASDALWKRDAELSKVVMETAQPLYDTVLPRRLGKILSAVTGSRPTVDLSDSDEI
jgi:hypothetical protein